VHVAADRSGEPFIHVGVIAAHGRAIGQLDAYGRCPAPVRRRTSPEKLSKRLPQPRVFRARDLAGSRRPTSPQARSPTMPLSVMSTAGRMLAERIDFTGKRLSVFTVPTVMR